MEIKSKAKSGIKKTDYLLYGIGHLSTTR